MSAPWSILFGLPGVHSACSGFGVFFQRHVQCPSGGSDGGRELRVGVGRRRVVFDANVSGM